MNTGSLSIAKKTAIWMIIGFIIAGVLLLAYYEIRGRLPGRVSNAQIEIESSVIFSLEEIESAIDAVIRDFANSRDSWNELPKIVYDEGYSKLVVESRGWDSGNAIVLIANYQSHSGPGSIRPSTMRTWEWP